MIRSKDQWYYLHVLCIEKNERNIHWPWPIFIFDLDLFLYYRSEVDDPNESPESKAERERLRRQANNARER